MILRNANIVIYTFMEKKELQILSEIRQMIVSMRAQLDELEMKVSMLAEEPEIEESDDTPIDIDIEDVFDDVPFTVSEPVCVSAPEHVEPEQEPDILVDDEVVLTNEDVQPRQEMLIDAAAANAKPVIIDKMTAKEAWRSAIPGSLVKDIRSAISLHDRIIFINGLFDEDPMLFQEVLTAINSMSSLDDVVDYHAERRPEWDMDSDEVYRFMMAVRRRIQ